MAQLNFNAQQHEPSQAFTPLPDGWYPVMVTNSEMKPTKPPKQGAYLNLELTVQGGEHNGRKLFVRLNLHNENPVAVEIAQRELSAICHVTGVMQLNDSQQLHGIPFQVKVVLRPPENGYDASNDVKGYRDIHGNEPGKAGGPGQAQPQGPGPTGMPQQPQQPPAQGQWQQQQPPAQQTQQGGWQQQQPPEQQPQYQQPPQQQPQQGQWNQGGQQVQPQGQPQVTTPPPQQGQPQPEQQQGYTQPPQGGQATPTQPPAQGDQSGVPPWMRGQQQQQQ